MQEADRLLFQLISRYVGIVVFNAVVRLATKYRDIEAAHEETRRASWEDSMLHVQNMVLDNCLSTIKHETIYYPDHRQAEYPLPIRRRGKGVCGDYQ